MTHIILSTGLQVKVPDGAEPIAFHIAAGNIANRAIVNLPNVSDASLVA